MRKTLIAIVIGVTALTVAACGNSGSGSGTSTGGGASSAPLESTAPLDSASGGLESPSDMLPSDSPASS